MSAARSNFMRAQYADIETIADVAEACAIGTRTLEVSFRQVWSQSPHAALTEIRLGAARRRLSGERAVATVTEAAFDSGFNHLGRFAGAYRARFDESPSHTRRRTLL
jgi:transcriptional regulator GlxA family with amidase domain